MQMGMAVRAPQAREHAGRGVAALPESSVHWFAAYTNSHHEKRVALQLAERQMESFLPLYTASHRWKNRCERHLELPLFPNYVFVRIDPRERVRVLEVPGVLSLVSFGRTLAPLPNFEIEALRSAAGQRKIEPHPYLVIGDRVCINAGPMTGMEGILIRKKGALRVVLTLDAIMQSVSVEVAADDVERVPQFSGVVPQSGFSGEHRQQPRT
jgi:transcription antitermination factor NusG